MNNSLIIGIAVVPTLTTALLFVVFTYLHNQGRHGYFRAWQAAWGLYCLSLLAGIAAAWAGPNLLFMGIAKAAFVGVALALYYSRRLMRSEEWKPQPADYLVAAAALLWALLVVPMSVGDRPPLLTLGGFTLPVNLEIGMAALVIYTSYAFLRDAIARGSVALRVLSLALAFWALLLLQVPFGAVMPAALADAGTWLGPLPQMLLGIAMVMVLFEDERRRAQDALLAFSSMDVDLSRVLKPAELRPSLDKLVERLLPLAQADRGILLIFEPWRHALPTTAVRMPDSIETDLGAMCTPESVHAAIKAAHGDHGGVHEHVALLTASNQSELAGFLNRELLLPAVLIPVRAGERFFGALVVPAAGQGTSTSQLSLLNSVAMQLGTTVEKYVLMHEEQRRARYFAFLNNISKAAISSQTADEMLPAIVEEIQQNFQADHIGIGIIDYSTKDIEIKAEAGSALQVLGKRIPIGVGILGRVARTSEMSLVQGTSDEHLLGLVPQARSVLAIPISYSDTLMGVLNVESLRENAFADQEVLILRTLADLLATALHNVLVFQKMQQQSITDGLTNIKTRRYFLEAVQAEFKRASRTGRPFSVVLIDLDKFKEVNDGMGHLEGDLVLARIGRLLEQKVRQSNVVARYGGDEFVILMPETSVEQAEILSERLRLWIATDPFLNDRHITGSFGVAAYPVHGNSVEDIIRVADIGMYMSKHAGGNKVSSAEMSTEGPSVGHEKQLVQTYVEGFLRREHTGPGSAEELVHTLEKLGAAIGDGRSAEALMDAVRTLTRAVETRELHAAGHGENVAAYSEALARELSLPEDEIHDLIFAARVHDVGKIIIPEKILNKATKLNPDEYELVKQHAEIGAQILATIPGTAHVADMVRHHHERFDGTGYPSGLVGEKIPLGARIIALVESYTNMTADRPYAPLRSHAEAVREIESLSGTHYDGMLVRLLIRHLDRERAISTGA